MIKQVKKNVDPHQLSKLVIPVIRGLGQARFQQK
jgi:hypothetical protein